LRERKAQGQRRVRREMESKEKQPKGKREKCKGFQGLLGQPKAVISLGEIQANFQSWKSPKVQKSASKGAWIGEDVTVHSKNLKSYRNLAEEKGEDHK